jgi:hypothetical protein
MPTERVRDHFEPLEPASADLEAEIAAAVAAAPFLADLLTPDRAVELFRDDADRMRACILASQGPARHALTAVIAGPQARRAALAYERLIQINGSDLPDAFAAILIRAAGTPRSAGVNGREGILSPIEAQNAALAHRVLWPSERDALAELMSGAQVAGREDASPAQALILKALAARRMAFADLEQATRTKALGELSEFAGGIKGLEFGELMRSTSLLDIDETIDTLSFDPLSIEDRPGALADRPLSYAGADNDGLFQRYEMSCGPASIEVLLGERDPAYALRRRMGRMDVDPAAADDIQTQILKQYGMTPASRVVPTAIVRLRGALSALEAAGQLSHAAVQQVTTFLLGPPASPKGPLVDGALETIRAARGGFPDAATAQQIRDYVPPDEGRSYNTIGFQNVAILLSRILGVEYKLHSLYAEQNVKIGAEEARDRSPDYVRANLDRIERNLANGIDIVFGTGNPDHFWSLSNVQGEAPNREFLVHDTWSGKTGWVDEASFIDARFARAFLGERKTKTFIDLMYLVD